MHTARIPPADPAPATITAVLAMHAGHIWLGRRTLADAAELDRSPWPLRRSAVPRPSARTRTVGQSPPRTGPGSVLLPGLDASRIANATSRGEALRQRKLTGHVGVDGARVDAEDRDALRAEEETRGLVSEWSAAFEAL